MYETDALYQPVWKLLRFKNEGSEQIGCALQINLMFFFCIKYYINSSNNKYFM